MFRRDSDQRLCDPQRSLDFPFHTCPHMLKSLLPEIPPSRALVDDEGVEDFRNRSITKRRVLQYGPTPECDGCLRGTYSHTAACRARFNALLDAAEPLALHPGGVCRRRW